MPEAPQLIEKIEDIVKIGYESPRQWFRGQAADWALKALIFRDRYANVTLPTGGNYEGALLQHFQLEAPAYHNNPPKGVDDLDWLFLAQHHGLPTRLLDWSKNVLVATYFAVSEKEDCDGELRRMDPYKLNGLRSIPDIAFPENQNVTLLVQQAFNHTDRQHGPYSPHTPIAVLPYLDYPRLAAQSSVCTLHTETEDKDEEEWLDQLSKLDASARYVIPAGKKSEIRKALNSLGMSRRFLFPNLDSLCADLRDGNSMIHAAGN